MVWFDQAQSFWFIVIIGSGFPALYSWSLPKNEGYHWFQTSCFNAMLNYGLHLITFLIPKIKRLFEKQSRGERESAKEREVRWTAQLSLAGALSNAGKQYTTPVLLLLFFIRECLPEITITLLLNRAGGLVYQSVSMKTNTRENLLQYGWNMSSGLTATT